MTYNKRQFMPRYVTRNLSGILLWTICVLSLLVPSVVSASSSFVATPAVIDGKGKIREILHYNMTLVNTTKRLVSVYPWVTDMDNTNGESGTTDLAGTQQKALSESLARWIEVTRGSVDLLPGEQKEIPITVQVNLNAKPGLYHATIHLSAGSDRASAEANKLETTDIVINIEVLDDINERLELSTFIPTKNVFSNNTASFNYGISNIGNRGEVPRGKIRIYDKKGREVATIDANQEATRLEPSAKAMLSSVWASDGNFGRYKAMLDLEYGGHGTLQDTVFFWVIPWKKLLGMFFSLIVLCVAVAIVLHSYGQSRRSREFAVDGVTNRRFWNIFPQGDEVEESDEEEWEDVAVNNRNTINELREVPPPPPVHTRLHSERSTRSGATHLYELPKENLSSHKVVLGKKETPKPNEDHIINLRR